MVWPGPVDTGVATSNGSTGGRTRQEPIVSVLSVSPTSSRKVLAGIVALLLVSLAIVRTSDAAFSAQTTNEGSQFATGNIDLDTQTTSPLFTEFDLIPGDVRESCIEITYTGSVGADDLAEVELAVATGDDAGGLLDELDVATDLTNSCVDAPTYVAAGKLMAVAGATGWTPDTPGETQAFHFQVTVGGGAPQDATVDEIDLTWSLETSG